MQRDHRRLALLLVVGLVASSCGGHAATPSPAPSSTPAPSASPSAPATPSPTPSPELLTWTDCGGGFECASLVVPLDYAQPAGPGLRLSLIRAVATDPAARIGSLVVNPGGPGASGVDFVRANAAMFPAAIRRQFDIVGFDPRGVGLSTPVLCQGDLGAFVSADADPQTAAAIRQVEQTDQAFSTACAQNAGALLPYVTTENVAQDLDQIRAALGEVRLTYLGYSYGTFIGELYAQRFPTHIRALVLDAVVDPALDLEGRLTGQAQGFEGALDRFLADCARRSSCLFHEGGHSAAVFDRIMAGLAKAPLPTGAGNGGRTVSEGLAWEAILGALYTPAFGWPYLAATLALAAQGDGVGFLAAADSVTGRKPDGEYDNEVEAQVATNCADEPGPSDPAAYLALADKLQKAAPRVGRVVALTGLICASWPVRSSRVPAPVTAPGAPPILLVSSTGDPATPHTWAVTVAKQLRSAVLLTRNGEGHGSYALGDTCIDGAVDRYLVSLTTPAAGTTCP